MKAFGRRCTRRLALQIGLEVLIFCGSSAIVMLTNLFTVDSDQRIWHSAGNNGGDSPRTVSPDIVQ